MCIRDRGQRGAANNKELAKEVDLQKRIKEHLESGKLAISFETDDEDAIKWIKEYNLLSGKPVIYAANVSEDDLADDGASNPYGQKVREYAKEFGSEVFAVCCLLYTSRCV